MKTMLMMSWQINACDFGWIELLLWGLIPFLLGLALGWILWAKYKKQVEGLRDDLSRANSLNAKLEGDLKGLRVELEECSKRKSELEKDLTKCRSERTKLQSEVGDLQASLKAHEEKAVNLTADLDASNSARDKAAADLSAAMSDHEKAKAALAASTALAGGVEKDLDDHKSKLEAANDARAKAEADLKVCGDRSDELKSDLDKANDRIKSLETEAQNALKVTSAAAIGAAGLAATVVDDGGADDDDVEARDDDGGADDDDVEARDVDVEARDGDVEARDVDGGADDDDVEARDVDVEARDVDVEARDVDGGADDDDVGSRGAVALPYSGPKDDLTKVEGVGPKIAGLFNDDGIYTWSQLSEKDPAELKAVLDAAGSRYQMHDPGTWPRQAKMLAEGDPELEVYQDYLIGGRDPMAIAGDLSDEEPDLVQAQEVFGKKIAFNDLKLIEGIGPKIEELLNNAGINSWKELAQTNVDRIQEILNEAGPRYGLAKPGSWPKQSLLAAMGKWSDLLKLQDDLDGGV